MVDKKRRRELGGGAVIVASGKHRHGQAQTRQDVDALLPVADGCAGLERAVTGPVAVVPPLYKVSSPTCRSTAAWSQ